MSATHVHVSTLLVLVVVLAAPGRAEDRALGRALGFLQREVPLWKPENHCYSCHNNGDAARALYEARRVGLPGPTGDPLADTTAWLAQPERWDRNGGQGTFSDKLLARAQFAASLVAAVDSGAQKDRGPLLRAAEIVVKDQAPDGCWPIEGEPNVLGSPAAYGRPLVTLSARATLHAADPTRHRPAIQRADAWLAARPVNSVMDAAITLLALTTPGRAASPADAQRQSRALERLRMGLSTDGGWGPYVDAPPEPFDTALVLLALSRLEPTPESRGWIERGRAYLAATQRADGSWPETTRPPGAESYAQRLSTAGWATLALIATRR